MNNDLYYFCDKIASHVVENGCNINDMIAIQDDTLLYFLFRCNTCGKKYYLGLDILIAENMNIGKIYERIYSIFKDKNKEVEKYGETICSLKI